MFTRSWLIVLPAALCACSLAPSAQAQQIKLLEQKLDPHGFPRPERDSVNVPLRTSFYFELGTGKDNPGDRVQADSVTFSLHPEGADPTIILRPKQEFRPPYTGKLAPHKGFSGNETLTVNIDSDRPLKPNTKYTAHVTARTDKGAELTGDQGSWSFTTGAEETAHPVSFSLDLAAQPVRWHGAFFSGFCNVVFCTEARNFLPTYEMMDKARKEHPRAWSFQRDFWTTGFEHQPKFFSGHQPNAVRERETRRIRAIEKRDDGLALRVEDVFGIEQYGVEKNRPLAGDYHEGDEVLIADGVHDAHAKVIAVDENDHTVTVTSFKEPEGGWKIAYAGKPPTKEDPDAPGLFAPGGCYLRKLKPHGTPCYYWGRLDKEWDQAHKRFGRRIMPNFADAAGDLSRDGRDWTTVKDYDEWHEVVLAMAGHIIDRYGADSLQFTWSIFNEPDLGPAFWRADWNELQAFYDYTTDAILRAFEDRGYDSKRVFIGGLELGGIFGTNLRLREFLAHCSPTAEAPGAVKQNAAFTDTKLDGKRSRRVEELCRAHDGKGSPCDFISIHSYNRSEMMAAKLIRAKEIALEIDPEYYKALWVDSHESCPEWAPPPDTAAADSYLGNGYFPTWCIDVARRQLGQAARDPRYGYGETILTVWPPNQGFAGANACSRIIPCDDNGDGVSDRSVTVPMPIFHALTLLSDMHDRFWILPEPQFGGHKVSGFASREDRAVRVLVYSQHPQDTQSRSEAAFDVSLDLAGVTWPSVKVTEYLFDKHENSYYELGRKLRDRPAPGTRPLEPGELEAIFASLRAGDPAKQLAAIQKVGTMGASAQPALEALLKLAAETKDESIRTAANAVVLKVAFGSKSYTRKEVEEVERLATLHATRTSHMQAGKDGHYLLNVRVAGNGCNFVIIEPESAP